MIDLGQQKGVGGTKKEVFKDFINAVKTPEINLSSPIDNAFGYYIKWLASKDKELFIYPPYIGYLILFTIPLTEKSKKKYNVNNYYDRINDFFEEYGVLERSTISKITTMTKTNII